jgi:hypothetical protein
VTPLYPQKLALASPTGGGRSVGIVRSRTKAMEFSLVGFIIRKLVMMHGHMNLKNQSGHIAEDHKCIFILIIIKEIYKYININFEVFYGMTTPKPVEIEQQIGRICCLQLKNKIPPKRR